MSVRTSRSARRDAIGPIACRSCDLNEICRLSGLIAFDGGRGRQPTGALRAVRAGAPLFRAGAPAHSLYAVRQGMLKTVCVSADGDEHILALNTPGDVLGLEAFSTGTYASDAIALQPVVCCELPLRLFGEHGMRVGELAAALVRLLSRAVAPRFNPARGSIRQRLTNFLLDLGARLEDRGLDGRQFALGLSRQEIADLLDTRIETVSRMMQQLNREQAIRVRGSRVSLLALTAVHESPGAADGELPFARQS
jgi:CRP/FNR family transcriptional regulator, anaerobic regulatory protein